MKLIEWVMPTFQRGKLPLSSMQKSIKINSMLRTMDSNGDGMMSFEEFSHWHQVSTATRCCIAECC